MTEKAKRECHRLRLAIARDAARWTSETAKLVSHRKLYHHSHHLAYCVYYVFALIEHRGLEAIISGTLLAFTAIAAIAGE